MREARGRVAKFASLTGVLILGGMLVLPGYGSSILGQPRVISYDPGQYARRVVWKSGDYDLKQKLLSVDWSYNSKPWYVQSEGEKISPGDPGFSLKVQDTPEGGWALVTDLDGGAGGWGAFFGSALGVEVPSVANMDQPLSLVTNIHASGNDRSRIGIGWAITDGNHFSVIEVTWRLGSWADSDPRPEYRQALPPGEWVYSWALFDGEAIGIPKPNGNVWLDLRSLTKKALDDNAELFGVNPTLDHWWIYGAFILTETYGDGTAHSEVSGTAILATDSPAVVASPILIRPPVILIRQTPDASFTVYVGTAITNYSWTCGDSPCRVEIWSPTVRITTIACPANGTCTQTLDPGAALMQLRFFGTISQNVSSQRK